MSRTVGISFLLAGIVLAGAGLAAADDQLNPAGRLVYPWVVSDATRETLIAVTRVDNADDAFEDPMPIHLNFFDDGCLVRDREDALTRYDVDIYVYGGFATGIPEGHLEIHEQSGTAHGDELCTDDAGNVDTQNCDEEGSGPFIGDAIIIDFANDAMLSYSAVAVSNSLQESKGAKDNVLGVPGFLAEVPGVLTNRLILAAVPCFRSNNCDPAVVTNVDVYPSGSSDVFTVAAYLFDGNEEGNSAHFTWKCGLNKSLTDLFGPIAGAGFLPPDAQAGPRILFFPYGWVRLGIEHAPTALDTDNWWAAGIFYQQYADGIFSWAEARNLWYDLSFDPGLDGDLP